MSRLTRYHQESLLTDEGGYYEPNASNYYDIVVKLGQIEDLEDELGCPLEVIASKTAMVVKNDSILEMPIMAIGFNDGTIYFGSSWKFITRNLKDYKKTWFLSSDLEE